MNVRSWTDSTSSADAAAFRRAALVAGAVSIAFVGFFRVVPWLVTELFLAVAYDPTTGEIPAWLGTVTSAATTVALPGTVVLGAFLAFYLTAGRDLPVTPVLAGTFAGAMLAPVGELIARLTISPVYLAGPTHAFYTAATITIVFVVPLLLAALLGSVVDDLWERGARWRGTGS